MTEPAPRKSDLGVRVVSAVVMVAVAGTALWLGGWALVAFVAAVFAGLTWELWGLLSKAVVAPAKRLIAFFAGTAYFALACAVIVLFRSSGQETSIILLVLIAAVVATDICAYFVGRSIRGPKIAPAISPSKTWSGLVGGMIGATLVLAYAASRFGGCDADALLFHSLWIGPVLAIVAQSGDFLESWLKRRAGVKDSSNLIPGHGGLFDRLDGMAAVFSVFGLVITLVLGAAAGGM